MRPNVAIRLGGFAGGDVGQGDRRSARRRNPWSRFASSLRCAPKLRSEPQRRDHSVGGDQTRIACLPPEAGIAVGQALRS